MFAAPLVLQRAQPMATDPSAKLVSPSTDKNYDTEAQTTTKPAFQWKGAKPKPLAITIAVGVIFCLIPCPETVNPKAWRLLAIFLSTIVGIITGPLPLGAVALLGLGACTLTKTLTFAQAFSAMSNEIPWLIALAFFFAKGFIATGLGNRIAYQFVYMFGSTSLGLTYSLVFSEAILAPAIPRCELVWCTASEVGRREEGCLSVHMHVLDMQQCQAGGQGKTGREFPRVSARTARVPSKTDFWQQAQP